MAETHQQGQDFPRGRKVLPMQHNRVMLHGFFVTEANKKVLIHKEKSRFPLSCTDQCDFEIFKKAVFGSCGVQSSKAVTRILQRDIAS